MNAQKPVFYSTGADKRPENAPDFFAFDASDGNMDYKKAKPLTTVALLFSDQSRNWELRFAPANSIIGCAQTLDEMHIPYQFISEDTLNPKQLSQFKVLCLGAATCLTESQIQEIRAFAERGGTVIFEPLTATRDHLGIERTAWPLKDIFGFELKAGYYAKQKVSGSKIAGNATQFLRPMDFMPPMGKDALPNEYAGQVRLTLNDNTEVPAAYQRSLGKGRIIYIPARLTARMYYEDFKGDDVTRFTYDMQTAATLRFLLDELLGPEARVIRTNAPSKVFITCYQAGEATYLHLLNGLGSGNGKYLKAAPKDCFPPMEQEITLTIHLPELHEVTAASPDFSGARKLAFQKNSDGSFTATLPKELLKVYTIVKMK